MPLFSAAPKERKRDKIRALMPWSRGKSRDGSVEDQTPRTLPETIENTKARLKELSVDELLKALEVDVEALPRDLWNSAYHEAVVRSDNLTDDVKRAILHGESVAKLFEELEAQEKSSADGSLIVKGIKYLEKLDIPLKNFKLALDLAAPLTNLEPTTSTVFSIIKGVTAVAISVSSADADFGRQIGEMLEQISYIDDCDTLGQKINQKDIHLRLVIVYQKLLEFYQRASEALQRTGIKLVWKIILEQQQLPAIVADFLKSAASLQELVAKATLDIVSDIKTMLYDQAIEQWLDKRKLEAQNQHHDTFKLVCAGQACEFMLSDPKFINWYHASTAQQLVLFGHMGSGKTMVMSFLVEELRHLTKAQLPQGKVCYHYCRNDETGDALYILSSLLFSFLQQFPGFKKPFVEWYQETLKAGVTPSSDYTTLEAWFGEALETIDRPLFFVIDGLDECETAKRNRLINTVQSLSQRTNKLKVLLSSRPEEEIVRHLGGMAVIDMPSDPKRDRIIVEKTVDTKVTGLCKEVRELVVGNLSSRAHGSAIWIKMTVQLIAIEGHTAYGPMEVFLEESPAPKELSELYVSLFQRYTLNHAGNQRLALLALQILAVSRRPLSVVELGWAVALGAAKKPVKAIPDLTRLVDASRVVKWITPFVSAIEFDDLRKRQVKIVHQSVKEYLIAQWASKRLNEGNTPLSEMRVDEETIKECLNTWEGDLLTICTNYLLLQDIGKIPLFEDESEKVDLFLELPGMGVSDMDDGDDFDPTLPDDALEENMVKYDPVQRGLGELFVYASCTWTEHFAAISLDKDTKLLPSLATIETICHARSTRLENWLSQSVRPNCTVRPRFELDTKSYDPLVFASLRCPTHMLQDMLDSSDLAQGAFLPETVRNAAEQILKDSSGDLRRIELLRKSKSGHQLQTLEFLRLAISEWSRPATARDRDGWDVVFDVVLEALDIMVEGNWGNRLILYAVVYGCMPVVKRLMESAKDNSRLRSELLSNCQCDNLLVGEAIYNDHVEVVEYLLAQEGIEAHVNHTTSKGQNMLHLASKHANPAVFRLLMPHLKHRVLEKDKTEKQDTCISFMTLCSLPRRYDAMRIVLAGAADRDGEAIWQERRRCSKEFPEWDPEMCKLLLEFKPEGGAS